MHGCRAAGKMHIMDLSVLIATADQARSEIYERLLTSCGYEVETASGGLECLSKLCDLVPDVLVLDAELNWGGADGVLAHLREEESTILAVPVVLITSDKQPNDSIAHLIAPPVVYRLQKPFRLSTFLEAVSFAADYHRQSSIT
jgi:CheY-like chemotaxis protein